MDLIPELMQIGAQGPELGWQGEEMVSRLKKRRVHLIGKLLSTHEMHYHGNVSIPANDLRVSCAGK